MPNLFPTSRYLLIALAATMFAAAVPVADVWLHSWIREHGQTWRTDRRVHFLDEMPIRVRPISPLH